MDNKVFLIILIGVLILVLIYFIKKNPAHIERFETGKKTAVLLKTHIWNDSLEKFANKIYSETVPFGIDFFILIHSDNGSLVSKINDKKLIKNTIVFSENDIKKVYDKGFLNMWLSNHWILMWFYRNHRAVYDYIWSVEYDVRIGGNGAKIWKYDGSEDFVYPIEPFQDANWRWKNHYVGKMTDKDKYYGYLQLARYSDPFLRYMDNIYQNGENGQDEMMAFSLLKRGNFIGSKDLLSKLIKNSWSVASTDSDKHKKLMDESENEYKKNSHHVRIFHPIK